MMISDTTKLMLLDIDIEDLADKLGMEVKRHKSLCFMHDDHDPSLRFYPRNNSWYCFVCRKGGDNINLVMEKLGLNFLDACRWMANEYNIALDEEFDEEVASRIRIRMAERMAVPEFKLDLEILQFILDYSGLGPKAERFLLNERRIKSDIVLHLNIKSVAENSTLAEEIVKVFGRERALQSRLVYEFNNRYRLYFKAPCLLFPYYDVEGNLMNVQSRYLGDQKGCPRFQFPMGSQPHVFNLPALNEEGIIFVSEGVTDCLAMLSSGKNALAIPSASLLKDEDVKLLAGHDVRMYPDNDDAGERLFTELRDKLELAGGRIMRMTVEDKFKDYGEFYRTKGFRMRRKDW